MALSDVIGRLSAHLDLETTAFEKGSSRAKREVSALERHVSKAGVVIKGAFAGMLGAFAVDQIVAAAKESLDFAASLGEVATQLGVTTDELQTYRYAATQTGIAQDEMDKGLAKLSRTIGQAANGNKAAAAMFDRLNISVRDSSGNVRAAGDILPEIADRYVALGSAAEQSALSAEVFGSKLGQKLNPLLAEGATGIKGFLDRANEMGLVIDKAFIDKADKASDNISTLQDVIKMKFTVAVVENSEAIGNMADELVNLIGKIGSVRDELMKLQLYMQKVDIWTAPIGSTSWQERVSGAASVDRQLGMITGETQAAALWRSRNRAQRRQRADLMAPFKAAEGPLGTLVGGNLGRAIKGGALTDQKMAPWQQQLLYGGKRNAVGGSAFGGGFGQFDPGSGEAGWMRMAAAANDMAQPVAAIDTMLARMATGSGVQLARNFRDAALDLERTADAAQNILDRLYPEDARARQYLEDLRTLKQRYDDGGLSADRLADAQSKLNDEFVRGMPAVDQIAKGFGKYMSAANDAAQQSEIVTVRVAQSFKDMADQTIGALDRVASAVKGGGFLNILSSVIGLGLQLGGAGLFGKGIQTNINRVPGNAMGTDHWRGGLSWVGERGPELVNIPRGSQVIPNHKLGGGGDIYHISGNLLTPEFWAQIRAGDAGAASAGAAGGVAKIGRSNRRAVG